MGDYYNWVTGYSGNPEDDPDPYAMEFAEREQRAAEEQAAAQQAAEQAAAEQAIGPHPAYYEPPPPVVSGEPDYSQPPVETAPGQQPQPVPDLPPMPMPQDMPDGLPLPLPVQVPPPAAPVQPPAYEEPAPYYEQDRYTGNPEDNPDPFRQGTSTGGPNGAMSPNIFGEARAETEAPALGSVQPPVQQFTPPPPTVEPSPPMASAPFGDAGPSGEPDYSAIKRDVPKPTVPEVQPPAYVEDTPYYEQDHYTGNPEDNPNPYHQGTSTGGPQDASQPNIFGAPSTETAEQYQDYLTAIGMTPDVTPDQAPVNTGNLSAVPPSETPTGSASGADMPNDHGYRGNPEDNPDPYADSWEQLQQEARWAAEAQQRETMMQQQVPQASLAAITQQQAANGSNGANGQYYASANENGYTGNPEDNPDPLGQGTSTGGPFDPSQPNIYGAPPVASEQEYVDYLADIGIPDAGGGGYQQSPVTPDQVAGGVGGQTVPGTGTGATTTTTQPTAPSFSLPTLTAPDPFMYADFVKPSYAQAAEDTGYQFAVKEGQRLMLNNAAANKMQKSGAFLKGLDEWGQGLGAQQYGTVYNRDLGGWQNNRQNALDTYNTNWGAKKDVFQGSLDVAKTKGNLDLNLYDIATRNLPTYPG